jgi:hypothetical protein
VVSPKAFDTMKVIPMPIGVSIQIILEVSDHLGEKQLEFAIELLYEGIVF